MRVVFCVKDAKGDYRVSAYGFLEGITDDAKIGEYIQKELSFTIERQSGDLQSFAEYLPIGIVSAMERREFYEFEVVSGAGNTGYLKILASAREQGCLPSDAP